MRTDPFKGGPQPAGFGNCPRCPYRDVGTDAVCYPCARQTMLPLPTSRCTVCEQQRPRSSGRCSNRVCGWPDRQFDWNAAIAMRSGALERAISDYKYGGVRGWAYIFGRVLAGFLYDQHPRFEPFDLVIPSPTYVGRGGRRRFDHTALVLAEAQRLDQTSLPFAIDPPVLRKTRETPQLATLPWAQRRDVCRDQLPPALQILDTARVDGRRVLVYDDVFTDGLNLDAVAGKLRNSGAIQVCGVTLARQPWKT